MTLSCSHCGKIYPTRKLSVLRAHERMHTGELPFECLHEGCTKRFSRKDCMRVHFLKHAVSYECAVESCGMTFGSAVDLYRHRRFHKSQCSICHENFLSLPLLRIHKLKVHNESEFRCTEAEKKYVCLTKRCLQMFATRLELESHSKEAHSTNSDYEETLPSDSTTDNSEISKSIPFDRAGLYCIFIDPSRLKDDRRKKVASKNINAPPLKENTIIPRSKRSNSRPLAASRKKTTRSDKSGGLALCGEKDSTDVEVVESAPLEIVPCTRETNQTAANETAIGTAPIAAISQSPSSSTSTSSSNVSAQECTAQLQPTADDVTSDKDDSQCPEDTSETSATVVPDEVKKKDTKLKSAKLRTSILKKNRDDMRKRKRKGENDSGSDSSYNDDEERDKKRSASGNNKDNSDDDDESDYDSEADNDEDRSNKEDGGKPMKPFIYTCPTPDCDRSFNQRSNLIAHMTAIHSSSRPFACPVRGCGQSFGFKHVLQRHHKNIHVDGKNPRITVSSFDSAAYIKQSLLSGITSDKVNANRAKRLEALGPPIDEPDSDSDSESD